MNGWMDGWPIGWQSKGWERAWVLDGITDRRDPLVLEVVQARSLMGALPLEVGGIVTPPLLFLPRTSRTHTQLADVCLECGLSNSSCSEHALTVLTVPSGPASQTTHLSYLLPHRPLHDTCYYLNPSHSWACLAALCPLPVPVLPRMQ